MRQQKSHPKQPMTPEKKARLQDLDSFEQLSMSSPEYSPTQLKEKSPKPESIRANIKVVAPDDSNGPHISIGNLNEQNPFAINSQLQAPGINVSKKTSREASPSFQVMEDKMDRTQVNPQKIHFENAPQSAHNTRNFKQGLVFKKGQFQNTQQVSEDSVCQDSNRNLLPQIQQASEPHKKTVNFHFEHLQDLKDKNGQVQVDQMVQGVKEPLSDISIIDSENRSEDIFDSPGNDEQFSFDDLESLQDANIDNELLENCFINSHINAEQLKFDKIARHSKTFGYVKLTEKSLKQKKKRLVKTWDRSFLIKVKTIDQKITYHSQRIKDLEKVKESQDNQTQKLLEIVRGSLENKTHKMLLKMEVSKLAALKNQKTRLIREQKQSTYAEILKNQHDHDNFDLIYSENFYKAKECQPQRKLSIKEDQKVSKSFIEGQDKLATSQRAMVSMDTNSILKRKSMVESKYTLRQDTILYYYWSMFIALNCLYSSIYYPYYTLNHFPQAWTQDFIILWVSELFFLIDIILGFFTQQLNEEGKSKMDPLNEVSLSFLRSTEFKVALLTLIPWGLVQMIDEKLKFLWAIKATRIMKLNSHFSDRQMLPLIQYWIHEKQQKYLKDPILRTNKETDQTFVKDKIYITNIMRIVRLILQILFVCFFFGQYWYIFSQTAHLMKFSESENEFESESGIEQSDISADDEFQSWVEYHGSWNVKEMSRLDKVLTSTYFACTSLSTVGFGDYYPVSDVERLVGSFYMLFGVAIFSYFMGELTEMMIKYNRLDNEVEEEEDLDKFLGVIKMFNDDNNLDQELTAKIRSFMRFKWRNDKNYFLADLADFKNFYSQLPTKCQRTLYTDFIFYDFLFKFRRFFSFRIPESRQQENQGDTGTFRSRGSRSATKITNSVVIQKLRKKISMMISLCSAMKNKELKPMSRREVFEMTERFRKRVKIMEEKNQVIDIQKKIEKIEQEGKISYEYKKNIKYPFLTFEDDKYSRFMTLIMQNLEVRQYHAGEYIAKELDECLEVLFVISGRYNVGYEVNNVERYRKQFGPCTMIGGFLVSFQKRFNFLYKAHSDMMCYAIRKKHWMNIMRQFPRFFMIVKQKSLAFHFCKILRPLLQMKNDEIEFFDRRKDYNQILATSQLQTKNIKEALFKLYTDSDEVEKANKQRLYTQDQICWLILTIQTKLTKAAQHSLSITSKSEVMQRLFWDQIIQNIISCKILNYPQETHAELYDTIVPIEDQLRINVFESENDNKKMINLIHRLWLVQNGKSRASDTENDLKPHIIAEFRKRLASRVSDFSSQISRQQVSQQIFRKQLHNVKGERVSSYTQQTEKVNQVQSPLLPQIISGQFDNITSNFNSGLNSSRGEPKSSKRKIQSSKTNREKNNDNYNTGAFSTLNFGKSQKISQTRPDIPTLNTKFQALNQADRVDEIMNSGPVDAGFQDIKDRKKYSNRFQSNTHRMDASGINTVQQSKNPSKQNTFRQQPMQSKNKPEPTHITAGQLFSDGGMTTIQSQAPVQFFDRFRGTAQNKSSQLEEEKIEEGPLVGRIRQKQNEVENIQFGTDNEEPSKMEQIIESISDVPEMFCEINTNEQNTEKRRISRPPSAQNTNQPSRQGTVIEEEQKQGETSMITQDGQDNQVLFTTQDGQENKAAAPMRKLTK